MALSTLEIFRAVAPEFSAKDDAEVNVMFEVITQAGELDPTTWGDMFAFGVARLAAHYFTLADRSAGAAGPVTSERAGEISINYGFLSNWDGNPLASTKHGQEYKRLMLKLAGTRMFTTGMTESEVQSG